MRLGELSEAGATKLRGAGMLPSHDAYAAGLERGNQALMKKHYIS